MKIDAISSGINTLTKYRLDNKQIYYLNPNFCGNDEYSGKKHKEYHEQIATEYDPINNVDIDNLVLKRPNLLSRFFDDGNNSDLQQLYNTTVNRVEGYPKCILVLNDDTFVKKATTFNNIWVTANSSIGSVKDTSNILFAYDINQFSSNLPPKGDYIQADYCKITDESFVDSVLSHSAFLMTGANVKNLKTNKLIITRYNHKTKENALSRFKTHPVRIENVQVIKENIVTSSLNLDSENKLWWKNVSKYFDRENGFADIEFCKINKLKCELLNAKNAKLKYVESKKCDNITNCKINTLKTNQINKISDSIIDKLIITMNTFDVTKDIANSVKIIEFENPNGILKVKNDGNTLPQVNVNNGKLYYELKNFMSDNLSVKSDLFANENVHIDNLIVTEPNAVITIRGNSEIKNIDFKNGGKVILKDDLKGKHPNPNNINVTNGEIVKDYKLRGFEKVAGMEELKQQLREDVIEPLEHPEIYKKYGLDVINGFLMYGPPGCGKTFIANQLAEETGRYFVEIGPSIVGSKFQHETAINIKNKFDFARLHAPSLVFIDEAESIVPRRDNLTEENPDYNAAVTEMLQQINNSSKSDILVVIASNEPQRIDNAIKRTGRMDKKIFVSAPDEETRKALFLSLLNKIVEKEDNIDIDKLAKLSEFYTAEDIRILLRQAAMFSMKNKILVSTDIIMKMLNVIKPSLDEKIVEEYRLKGGVK